MARRCVYYFFIRIITEFESLIIHNIIMYYFLKSSVLHRWRTHRRVRATRGIRRLPRRGVRVGIRAGSAHHRRRRRSSSSSAAAAPVPMCGEASRRAAVAAARKCRPIYRSGRVQNRGSELRPRAARPPRVARCTDCGNSSGGKDTLGHRL